MVCSHVIIIIIPGGTPVFVHVQVWHNPRHHHRFRVLAGDGAADERGDPTAPQLHPVPQPGSGGRGQTQQQLGANKGHHEQMLGHSHPEPCRCQQQHLLGEQVCCCYRTMTVSICLHYTFTLQLNLNSPVSILFLSGHHLMSKTIKPKKYTTCNKHSFSIQTKWYIFTINTPYSI